MKLSKCRNCQKFIDKDPWGQHETWKCICCALEVCVWCYSKHTVIHYHEIYPDLYNVDGSPK